MLLGIAAVAVVPGAIALARQLTGLRLVDAAWSIPFGFACGWLAIGFSNLARVRVQWTLGRAGGEGRARAARILGTIGILLAVTASISVGVYELLVRLEH